MNQILEPNSQLPKPTSPAPPPPVDNVEKQESLSSSQGASTPPDEVLTTPEAAAFLKIHPETLAKLCRTGKVPHGVIGREYRFSRQSLLKWLAQLHPGTIKAVKKMKERPASQIIAYVRRKGGTLHVKDGKLVLSGLRPTPILREALQARAREIVRKLGHENNNDGL